MVEIHECTSFLCDLGAMVLGRAYTRSTLTIDNKRPFSLPTAVTLSVNVGLA